MTDDGFIGMPPGMEPEAPDTNSGTIKHRRPERPEVVFRAVVPGAPAPPPPPPPPSAASAVPGAPPTAPPTAEPIKDPAPPTAPTPALTWHLRIPGVAEQVHVDHAVVLGRNPTAPPNAPDAALLSINDPAKSVSKTHAMVVVTDGALAVHDLDSTNGVWLVVAGSDPVRVSPGTPIPVPAGAELELGEFVIRVELA